jgi:hypothetical protein
MKRILLATLLAVSLLTACVAVPGRHGVEFVPFLPPLVVLEAEPYYYYDGFHYHYNNDRWFYSRSRGGPWYDLPRDHYPRELRYKGRGGRHGHERRHYDD